MVIAEETFTKILLKRIFTVKPLWDFYTRPEIIPNRFSMILQYALVRKFLLRFSHLNLWIFKQIKSLYHATLECSQLAIPFYAHHICYQLPVIRFASLILSEILTFCLKFKWCCVSLILFSCFLLKYFTMATSRELWNSPCIPGLT